MLAAAVNHKSTHSVVGPVAYVAFGKVSSLARLHYLQQGASTPISTCCGLGIKGDLVGNVDAITLVAQLLVAYEIDDDSTRSTLYGCFGDFGLHSFSEQKTIVLGQSLGDVGQLGVGVDDFGRSTNVYYSLASLPMAQFGNHKWLFIVGPQCGCGAQ